MSSAIAGRDRNRKQTRKHPYFFIAKNYNPRPLSNTMIERFSALFLVLLLLASNPLLAQTQLDDAKAALDRKEYARAVDLLTAELAGQPSAEVYLYLSQAYRAMREWEKAENVLKEGARRFPGDARFFNELADLYLSNNDPDNAKETLRGALSADSGNAYASDLLATIEMSEGNVRSALHHWNQS